MDSRQLAGTLDLLLLEVISAEPSYGYDITQQVFNRSDGTFELKEGSLYPALHRLERQKLLTSFWQEHDGRRRKYYRVTAAGKRSLDQRRQSWLDFARGVNGVLGSLAGGRPDTSAGEAHGMG